MSDIARAAKKTCVLISGQEDVLRSRALAGILTNLNILPDDFDVQSFDAQSSNPLEWIAAVETAPFLGEKRVAIVRHLLQRDAPKNSKFLFGTLPSSAMLILVADTVGGSDDRKTKAISQGKAWEKLVVDSKGAVLNYEPDPKLAKESLKSEASLRGIAISDRALETLVDMTGGSFSRSIEEFDKLSLFVGDTVTISERHVEAIVVPSKDWNVFKLADAVFENSPAEALKQLRSMIGNVSHAENAAFSQILPQISRLLKLIWQARVALDMGVSLNQAPPAYVESLPKKPNLLTTSPYQQSKIMKMARKATLGSLEKALDVVADTDAKLKGFLPSFSPIDSLEMMVLELTSATRG